MCQGKKTHRASPLTHYMSLGILMGMETREKEREREPPAFNFGFCLLYRLLYH